MTRPQPDRLPTRQPKQSYLPSLRSVQKNLEISFGRLVIDFSVDMLCRIEDIAVSVNDPCMAARIAAAGDGNFRRSITQMPLRRQAMTRSARRLSYAACPLR